MLGPDRRAVRALIADQRRPRRLAVSRDDRLESVPSLPRTCTAILRRGERILAWIRLSLAWKEDRGYGLSTSEKSTRRFASYAAGQHTSYWPRLVDCVCAACVADSRRPPSTSRWRPTIVAVRGIVVHGSTNLRGSPPHNGPRLRSGSRLPTVRQHASSPL
jgi:hypothetical protein